jgi:hypothetical protein
MQVQFNESTKQFEVQNQARVIAPPGPLAPNNEDVAGPEASGLDLNGLILGDGLPPVHALTKGRAMYAPIAMAEMPVSTLDHSRLATK